MIRQRAAHSGTVFPGHHHHRCRGVIGGRLRSGQVHKVGQHQAREYQYYRKNPLGNAAAHGSAPQAALSTGATDSVSSNSNSRPALAMPMKVLTLCNSAAMIGASSPSTPAPERTINPKVNANPTET